MGRCIVPAVLILSTSVLGSGDEKENGAPSALQTARLFKEFLANDDLAPTLEYYKDFISEPNDWNRAIIQKVQSFGEAPFETVKAVLKTLETVEAYIKWCHAGRSSAHNRRFFALFKKKSEEKHGNVIVAKWADVEPLLPKKTKPNARRTKRTHEP